MFYDKVDFLLICIVMDFSYNIRHSHIDKPQWVQMWAEMNCVD